MTPDNKLRVFPIKDLPYKYNNIYAYNGYPVDPMESDPPEGWQVCLIGVRKRRRVFYMQGDAGRVPQCPHQPENSTVIVQYQPSLNVTFLMFVMTDGI